MTKKIIYITFLLCGLLCLTSCGNKNLTADKAEALVTDFLEDFKAGNYTGMYSLTHDNYEYFEGMYNPDSASNREMFGALSGRMTYEIQNVQVDKKEAVVTVHITNVDVDKVLGDVTSTYLTACENDKTDNNLDKDTLLAETTKFCFAKEDAPVVEKDTVFNLIEKDKEWAIESNIMIYDDITGGYMTYYYKNVVFADMLKNNKAAEPK